MVYLVVRVPGTLGGIGASRALDKEIVTMPASTAKASEIKYCVVCGNGSHRTDWINKSGNFVACDSHSKDEVAKAVAKASAPAQTAAKPTAIPPALPQKPS